MSKSQPIDVRDMAIIHRTFRNVYEESARLVRAAPTPSPGRVTFLADHIDFAIKALHVHHDGEDEMLYPKLIERVPVQGRLDGQVLVLDLLGHRGLVGHPLDQLRVEHFVFALVMVVQRRDAEIDVIGQERDPPR